MLNRSWCEINLSQLIQNYRICDSIINSDIMAVVKADAYGHGAKNIAIVLEQLGVDKFAVSNIVEAKELRSYGIKGTILILGYTPVECFSELVRYNLTQAILSEDYARMLISSGLYIKCQYAIDTGMNRIGIDSRDVNYCVNEILYAAQYLELTGIFTHLCVADSSTPDDISFTKIQIQQISKIYKRIINKNLDVHFLNSAGAILDNDWKGSYVRLGISLYGLKTSFNNQLLPGVAPILCWKSVISMIKNIHKGDFVGYGRAFAAQNDMKVATIPTGYGDGYRRDFSNCGFVLVNGKKAKILGRICMDQFMIDITQIPGVKPYDEVVLLGKSGNLEISADDLANRYNTIGYEIVCNISKRVPRFYIN